MDYFLRLQEISIEISTVEEEKLRSEQRLGLFWEYFPPLDYEAVENMKQSIQNHIRGLEGRKEGLESRRGEAPIEQRLEPHSRSGRFEGGPPPGTKGTHALWYGEGEVPYCGRTEKEGDCEPPAKRLRFLANSQPLVRRKCSLIVGGNQREGKNKVDYSIMFPPLVRIGSLFNGNNDVELTAENRHLGEPPDGVEHEVGVASYRRSACRAEYVSGPCTHRSSHPGNWFRPKH
ncbi:hypothetical protein HAX54_001150 [Datura stramonium]|uniref:Uncharacterized protein n=1 Tax=Datura stramonium TaxID=4076 RepID=A0ABS8T1X7_DATST|nr:hypothetical protein [Datura stramonium]